MTVDEVAEARNDRVAQLLDLGFSKVPAQVATVRPRDPGYVGPGGNTIRLAGAPERSIRPRPKPGLAAPPEEVVVAIAQGIDAVVEGMGDAGAETMGKAPARLRGQDLQPVGRLALPMLRFAYPRP